jgi:hypothetical protein
MATHVFHICIEVVGKVSLKLRVFCRDGIADLLLKL